MATPDRPAGTQKELDDALADTFPASDPPAMTTGTVAFYASMSPAGAILEFLAHLDGEKPVDLVLLKARMPGRSVIKATSLPAQWRETPYRDDVREYGNAWVASRTSLALDLPSVLCEQSRNLLINPEHDDIAQLKVDSLEAFTLDRRLQRG